MGAGSMPAATGLQNCAAGAPGKIALLREAGAGDVSPAGPSVGDGEGLEVVEVCGSPLGAAWDAQGDVLAVAWKGRVTAYGWGGGVAADGEVSSRGGLLAEGGLRFLPQALALTALPGGHGGYVLALGGVLGVAFRILERETSGRGGWVLLDAVVEERGTGAALPPPAAPSRPPVVCGVAFREGAELMATASVDGTVGIWGIEKGAAGGSAGAARGLCRRLLFEGQVPADGLKVTAVQFSPDGLSLAVLSWSGSVSIFRCQRASESWTHGLTLPAADSAVLPHWLPPLLCWVSYDVVAMAAGGGRAEGVFYFRVCEGWLEPLGDPAQNLRGQLRGLALASPGARAPAGALPSVVTLDAGGALAIERLPHSVVREDAAT